MLSQLAVPVEIGQAQCRSPPARGVKPPEGLATRRPVLIEWWSNIQASSQLDMPDKLKLQFLAIHKGYSAS
jgi:hypothetical protein